MHTFGKAKEAGNREEPNTCTSPEQTEISIIIISCRVHDSLTSNKPCVGRTVPSTLTDPPYLDLCSSHVPGDVDGFSISVHGSHVPVTNGKFYPWVDEPG